MNKALGIAGVVLIVAFGLAFWLHGNARYAEGIAYERAAHSATTAAAKNESLKRLERIADDTRRLSDADVDASLSDLGIMRQPTDY